jgi:hypothetical protein
MNFGFTRCIQVHCIPDLKRYSWENGEQHKENKAASKVHH